MCYYFDHIIKIEDFGFDDILLNEKSYKNFLIYDISYISLIGAKPLRIRFDKIDGFIRIYDGRRYIVLFGPEKYDPIRKRNVMSQWLKVLHMLFLLIVQE